MNGHCRWITRLQFPLLSLFYFHADFQVHHLDPVPLCYLCEFWVVFPVWLWLSIRANQREGCSTSQRADTQPAASGYCR